MTIKSKRNSALGVGQTSLLPRPLKHPEFAFTNRTWVAIEPKATCSSSGTLHGHDCALQRS
eukprot:2045098-Heterocapsa_arctica.AAC.1